MWQAAALQQVNLAKDEITCMHQKDFHGYISPLSFIVTADRIYRMLTGSKDFSRVTLCAKN